MSHVKELFLSEVFWIAVGSILQGVGAIIAYSALRYSVTTFTKSLEVSNYTELDKMYFDLLHMAVENPHLADPNAKRNDEQQKAYDTYAYMVWNTMESIYDRCHGDKELCETWYPVIDAEEKRHREWFDDSENRPKFKDRFCGFVDERYKKHSHREHSHPA